MNVHKLNQASLNVAWLNRVGEPMSDCKGEKPEVGGDITFSINGTEYQTEDGMTWEQWCNSEYNTDGYYIDYFSAVGMPGTYVISDEYITDGSGSPWAPVAVFKQDKDLDMDYALSEEPNNNIIVGYDYRLFSPNNAD